MAIVDDLKTFLAALALGAALTLSINHVVVNYTEPAKPQAARQEPPQAEMQSSAQAGESVSFSSAYE